MNFYYGAGKIPHDEFRERCSAAEAAHVRRSAIFALLLGVVYLVIGKYYWLEWMSECSSKSPIHNVLWQAIWCLVALTVGPFLIGIFSFLSKDLGDWPRCPACGKKICRLLPTIASKRCLHCNTVIIEDKRQFVSGFELPPSLDEAIAKGIRVRSGGSDTQSLQSMRIVFIGTPMVVLSFFLVGVKGDIELEPLMEKIVLLMGFAIIAFCGIAPLIPIKWMIGVMKKLYIYPKEAGAFCPECGVVPSIYVARVSGCCADCGAKIAELPVDSDEFPTVDWHQFRHYWMWDIRGGMILAILTFPLSIMMKAAVLWWWPLLSVGVIWLFYFAILIKRKREAQIPQKCPNCQRNLSQAMWSLLHYGRCPHCRRKLVRDEDDGKGGRHV